MFLKMLINLKEHNGLFVSVPIHYGSMSFFYIMRTVFTQM